MIIKKIIWLGLVGERRMRQIEPAGPTWGRKWRLRWEESET